MTIWTLDEAANYLGVSPTELLQLEGDDVRAHYRGRAVWFDSGEVIRFKRGKLGSTQSYTPPIRAEAPKNKKGLVTIIVGALLRCIPGLETSHANIVAENVLADLRAHGVGMFRRQGRP